MTSILVIYLLFFIFKFISVEYKIIILIILCIIHFEYYPMFLEYIKSDNDDPSIYTLDETIVITIAWVYFNELNIYNTTILIIIFRFFDIIKPLGIKVIEKSKYLKPSMRNLADDMLAMLYTIIIFDFIKFYVV